MVARKEAEARAAAQVLGVPLANLRFVGLPDMKLDTVETTALNRSIEAAVRSIRPSIVYTHSASDINRDHRLVHEASLVACRPYSAPFVEALYAYFAPSATEWGITPFEPNHFVDISDLMETKIGALNAYGSEVRQAPHPRSPEALRAIFGSFGTMVGCRYAEAFRLVRSVRRG